MSTRHDYLDGLDAQEAAAISALMTQSTIERAAAMVGIHERTLRKWLAREEFRRAYQAALRETFEHVNARLQGVASRAVDTLDAVMADSAAPAAARVSAARAVLEAGARAIELAEVVERLDALEARLNADRGKQS